MLSNITSNYSAQPLADIADGCSAAAAAKSFGAGESASAATDGVADAGAGDAAALDSASNQNREDGPPGQLTYILMLFRISSCLVFLFSLVSLLEYVKEES